MTAGLVLKHVAIGRGTQNYTCDVTNATAEPVAAGAVATLFNASCVASSYPDLLHQLPKLALHFNLSSTEQLQLGSGSDWEQKLGPTNLGISGHHFFTNATTPFFTLDTSRAALGTIPCNKTGTTDAPGTAPTGQQGEGAVAWLKLQARSGATGNLQEVYRVETAGGSAPKSCSGLPAVFEIQYAAEYVFPHYFNPGQRSYLPWLPTLATLYIYIMLTRRFTDTGSMNMLLLSHEPLYDLVFGFSSRCSPEGREEKGGCLLSVKLIPRSGTSSRVSLLCAV